MPRFLNPYLEDDTREKVVPLIQHRLPWLVIGLIGGMLATIFSSYFERLLSENIKLAFFIPIIVYMSDAVGTQTETIYVRSLVKKDVKFSIYFLKELALGAFLGLFFGSLMWLFAYLWFKDANVALTVGMAMAISILAAPVIALIVPTVLFREKTDPAVGAGPFSTIIQDIITLLIYFLIASAVMLN